MNVAATTPEEFALILEPFPFLNDESKSELVEKSKPFFEFLRFMMDKHNTTSDIIQARIDMSVSAKVAVKMTALEKMSDDELGDDEDDTVIKNIMRDIFKEISEEEGFDGDLGAYAIALMDIQKHVETHLEKLIADGKEDEIKNFIKIMERGS